MFIQVTGNRQVLNGQDNITWSVNPKTRFNEKEFATLKRTLGRDYKAEKGLEGLALFMVTPSGEKGKKIQAGDTPSSLGLGPQSKIWIDFDDTPLKPQPPTETSPRNMEPLTLPQPQAQPQQLQPPQQLPFKLEPPTPVLPHQPIAMPPFPEPVKPVVLKVPPLLPLGPPPEILIPPAVQIASMQPPGAIGNKLLKKLMKLAKDVKTLKEQERDNGPGHDAGLTSHIAELQEEMQRLRIEVANSQLAVSAMERERSNAREPMKPQRHDGSMPQTAPSDVASQVSYADHWDDRHTEGPCPVHGEGQESSDGEEESEEDENREVRRKKDGWLEIWDADAGMLYYANEETQESRWEAKGTPFEEPARRTPSPVRQSPIQQQPFHPIPTKTAELIPVPAPSSEMVVQEHPELIMKQPQVAPPQLAPPFMVNNFQPSCDETSMGGSLLAPAASVASTSLPPGTVSVSDIGDLLNPSRHPQAQSVTAPQLNPTVRSVHQEVVAAIIPEGVNVGTPTPSATPETTPRVQAMLKIPFTAETQTTPTLCPETKLMQTSARGSRRTSAATSLSGRGTPASMMLDIPANDFKARQKPPSPYEPSLHSVEGTMLQQFEFRTPPHPPSFEASSRRSVASEGECEILIPTGMGIGDAETVSVMQSERESTPSPPPPPRPRASSEESEEILDLSSFRRLPSPPPLSPPRGPPMKIIDTLKHNTDKLPKGMKETLASLKFHDEWFHDLVYQSLRSYYYCEVRGLEQSYQREREKEELWLSDFGGLNCCDQEFDKAIPCEDVDVAAQQLLKDMGLDPGLLDTPERASAEPSQDRTMSPVRTRGDPRHSQALPPVLSKFSTPIKGSRKTASTFLPVRSPTDTSVATSELAKGWGPDDQSSAASSASRSKPLSRMSSGLPSFKDL